MKIKNPSRDTYQELLVPVHTAGRQAVLWNRLQITCVGLQCKVLSILLFITGVLVYCTGTKFTTREAADSSLQHMRDIYIMTALQLLVMKW